jgi:hypothetical protein
MFAATKGRLILLSTPRGKQGVFYRTWNEGEGWKKVKVTADECPHITKEYLDEERRTMGESWFRQEYCCEFTQEQGRSLRKTGRSSTFRGSFHQWT